MQFTEALKYIIPGILGLAGLILAMSRFSPRQKLDWRIGIGIPMFGLSLFILTTSLPQYVVGFSIIGTLIMAGAALMAIKQSDKQDISDRKERKLISIITWANDITKCETEVPITPLPISELVKLELSMENAELIVKHHNSVTHVNLVMRYQSLDALGKQIVLIAKSLDRQLDSELEVLAQKTSNKLTEHTKLGFRLAKEEIADEEYKKHWKSLLKVATTLAERTTELME